MQKTTGLGVVQLILGLLLLALGIFTFFNVDMALTTFVYVYGIAAIVFGIAEIVMFIMLAAKTSMSSAMSLVMGIVNIVVGVLLLFNVGAGIMAFSILFPFWLIFMSVARLFDLDFVRVYAGNGYYWLSLIINILGMLAGFVLLAFPAISLLTMSYTIGFYLIMISIELIILAVRCFQLSRKANNFQDVVKWA